MHELSRICSTKLPLKELAELLFSDLAPSKPDTSFGKKLYKLLLLPELHAQLGLRSFPCSCLSPF